MCRDRDTCDENKAKKADKTYLSLLYPTYPPISASVPSPSWGREKVRVGGKTGGNGRGRHARDFATKIFKSSALRPSIRTRRGGYREELR